MNRFLNPHKAKGLTMIEMMIAVGISAFLLLAVMVMFSSTSRSRSLQTSLSQLNESGRFAIDVLGRDLRMAGYRDDDWLTGAVPDSIVAVDGPAANGGDSITVRYEADRDCNYANTVGGIAVNTYALNMATLALECNGQPIIDDVEQMQIYFGQDIDGDGVANQLLPPDDPALQMERVVFMRLNLLVRSANERQSTEPQRYFFDDVMWQSEDSRLRRQYSITVALRNPI